MQDYSCKCGKEFKHKIPARHHLEKSHKGEILSSEVQMLGNSLECPYCSKPIEGSTKKHLSSHIKKIIIQWFHEWIS